ncbi:MAG: 50S ribosomal protein L21 [Gammaproteobacteria bacterium]|nr:50S ribosomal protein L21 [Gammaproteobacteria bacterium]
MHAVIETGGKQYRIAEGQKIKVEQLPNAEGEALVLDKVLSVGEGETLKVGRPYVEGAKVSAKIIAHGRQRKINVIKFKRRKQHMKRMGHRQNYSQIEIVKIEG